MVDFSNKISGSRNSVNDFGPKMATWVVTDGRIGIQNQAVGLAEAVGLPLECKTVHPRLPWTILPVAHWPFPFKALNHQSSTFHPPWPVLAIGCGWRSIPYILAIKKLSKNTTLTIQLQDPKISPKHFDLVIPPEHDRLSGPNVIPIIGSPNRVTQQKLSDAENRWEVRFRHLPQPRVAALIGGKSKSHQFSDDDAGRLGDQLRSLAAKGISILATTSRRTGKTQSDIIREKLDIPNAYLWNGEGENPYLGMLALADAILVTSDSTNMMVESAATGKPVHVFSLRCTNAKFEDLNRRLNDLGITRPFSGRIEQWAYVPLNETEKIARIIRGKLGI